MSFKKGDHVYYLPAIDDGSHYRDWVVIDKAAGGVIRCRRASDDYKTPLSVKLLMPEPVVDRLARLA